tara:strand:+ start:2240 stop:3907 length:1668 start_codon:yes stop_codon:yes gene_type:complete
MSFNYESKYGNGSNVDNFTQDTTAYYYFENLLDINLNYENINLYSQLEYSNPPIYGQSLTKTNNLSNSYFIEYFNDFIMLKWGHIQTINNYGLDINMFQDQSTDFDNRIKGIELNYMPNDLIEFSFITGKGNYGAKSYGDLRENDLIFSHDLDSYGMSIYSDFGDFSISTSTKRTNYKSGIYNNLINSDTRLSIDLQDYIFTDFSLFNQDSDVKSTAINFSYSKTLGDLDIYIENSANTYNKILRDEQEEGNYRYIALSGDFLGIGLTYEFKDYDMLYYMPITSNPPTVFYETSSVLISRIQHNINFSDEIGHQLELTFNSKYNLSYLFNLSMGMKHSGVRNPNSFEIDDDFNIIYDTYKSVSFNDFFGKGGMDFMNEDLRAHKPFRNLYLEISRWNNNNTFYSKVGYHSHYSYDNSSGKNFQTYTIPTQFVIGFENQNSLTTYAEYQYTKNLVANLDDFDQDLYTNKHLALSYYINKIGNITYLLDEEIKTNYIDGASKKSKWDGIELSIKMSPTMQLSIFKGSQKGGLVCANGVCAVQPSFENGTKITFRALF